MGIIFDGDYEMGETITIFHAFFATYTVVLALFPLVRSIVLFLLDGAMAWFFGLLYYFTRMFIIP